MRQAVPITLEARDRRQLQRQIRSRRSMVRLVERSKIVLLAAAGNTNKEISLVLGIDPHKVGRWRNRYAAQGYPGIIKDAPRGANHGGQKTEEQTRLRQKILRRTTQGTPKGATHWSTRSMAQAVGCQHSFVQRVWQAHGLKPHLVKHFKVSTDPRFEEKLHDVVGLYLNPPEKAVVLCVDEKSSIQALDRTQPGLPMKKGRCGTMTHDYKRHGTSTLFAALDVLSGQILGKCMPRHRHQEFLKFLSLIDRTVDKTVDLHIIMDHYATHKHATVQAWLAKHPRVHFHFIPTSSSWLNLVERFFANITAKQIRRGVFRSVEELEAAIGDYIAQNNTAPKPFVWTKSAETILKKVRRAKAALNALSV